MSDRAASTTAYGVAVLRAAHQIIDEPPPILDDDVIVRLLGPDTESRVHSALDRLQSPAARHLRSHVLLRSRVAEDTLRNAVGRGADQYVILGAGLDTFAYRQPEWAKGIDIVEVDHPGSQRRKRQMLADAGIAVPQNVRFADVDFERETLAAGLHRCEVAFDRRTVFSWLGVTMYLTREAIETVLRTVASFPAASTIVLTFAQPNEPGDGRSRVFAERAAEAGEPWISYFAPAEIEGVLRACGFSEVSFTDQDSAARYFANRRDELPAPRRTSIVTAMV